MKRTMLYLMVIMVLSSFTAIANAADETENATFHFRILVHGTQRVWCSERFGMAGWVIAPDITNKPNTWIGVFGPRFAKDGFHIELMPGLKIVSDNAVRLLDLRSGIGPKFFEMIGGGDRLPTSLWLNLEWIGVGQNNHLYLYFENNWILPGRLPAVGFETENVFFFPGNDISLGGHVVVKLHELKIAIVWQHHWNVGDRYWLRMIIDF